MANDDSDRWVDEINTRHNASAPSGDDEKNGDVLNVMWGRFGAGNDNPFGSDNPVGVEVGDQFDPDDADPFGLGDNDPFELDGDAPFGGLDLDVAEALGLPDRLPPMRLPEEAELAEAARGSWWLAQARDLAEWAGDGRSVDDEGELSVADAQAAASALGIASPVNAGATDDDKPAGTSWETSSITSMQDLPELVHLWRMADETGLMTVCVGHVHVDEDDDWEDDEEVLDLWDAAFAYLSADSLSVDAEIYHDDDIHFQGVGALVVVLLFIAGDTGVEHTELSQIIRESAVGELPEATGRRVWNSWTKAHGDPARVLVDRLEQHGAVQTDDDLAWITPLGTWAIRDQLESAGVEVPLLPPVEEMTAADLVAAAEGFSPEQLSPELQAWQRYRSPEAAVDELLTVASGGGSAQRMLATSIAMEIGPVGEQSWREALEQTELRPYAKMALVTFADAEPPDVPAGLEPEPADMAWLLTDVLAAMTDDMDPGDVESDEIVTHFAEAVPAGQEQAVLDVMWRLPHPDVHGVLTTLGRVHPDEAIAKAARKASFKSSSGQ